MRRTILCPATAFAVLVLLPLVGCEAKKSETPLSPSVAGPIPGVEISAPGLVEPSQGNKFKDAQQPIRLTIGNSSSSGVRPLSYTFEVATDAGYTTKVFARASVPPGQGGKTSVQLDKLELGRTYYWRARGEDGANTGPYMTARFDILPRPFISAPVPISPANNEQTSSRRPALRAHNVDKNAAVGGLVYEFQVSSNQAFTQITGTVQTYEGAGETSATPGADLPNGATQYWRARAFDAETASEWGPVQVFRTPNVGPPTPGPTPSPGGGGSCALGNGPAIISCISAKYADKRAPVGSQGERQANMIFLRDRIIEAGKCSGLDYGYNLKRGGPEYSIDVIAWKRPDGNMGVDIAFDYDNLGNAIQLMWSEIDLQASYAPYGNVSCGGV
jgi:hypothetical protein